jgi:hypothetical protein
MPIRTFWSMIRNANRLKASEDMRLLHLLASAQAPDVVKDTREALAQELGKPLVTIDNRRDENATQKLRDAFG